MSLVELIADTQQQYVQLGDAAQKNVSLVEDMETVVASVKSGLDAVVASAVKAVHSTKERLQALEGEVATQLRTLTQTLEASGTGVTEAIKATESVVNEVKGKTLALRTQVAEAVPVLAKQIKSIATQIEALTAREKELVTTLTTRLTALQAEVDKVKVNSEQQQATVEKQVLAIVSAYERLESERQLQLQTLTADMASLLADSQAALGGMRNDLEVLSKRDLGSLASTFAAEVEPVVTKLGDSLAGKVTAIENVGDKPRALIETELGESQTALQTGLERLKPVEQTHRNARNRQILV